MMQLLMNPIWLTFTIKDKWAKVLTKKNNWLRCYHGIWGISLGMFLVLHGALKLPAQFLPNIPPRMVNGKPTLKKKIQT